MYPVVTWDGGLQGIFSAKLYTHPRTSIAPCYFEDPKKNIATSWIHAGPVTGPPGGIYMKDPRDARKVVSFVGNME